MTTTSERRRFRREPIALAPTVRPVTTPGDGPNCPFVWRTSASSTDVKSCPRRGARSGPDRAPDPWGHRRRSRRLVGGQSGPSVRRVELHTLLFIGVMHRQNAARAELVPVAVLMRMVLTLVPRLYEFKCHGAESGTEVRQIRRRVRRGRSRRTHRAYVSPHTGPRPARHDHRDAGPGLAWAVLR
jgi:hypothetical protein